MMNRALIAGVLAATVSCGGAAPPAVASSPVVAASGCHDWVHDSSGSVVWEPNDDEDGIKTFTGEVPGSDYLVFRGAGAIDAPIAKVANVLINTTRHPEWVPNFGGMRLVRSLSKTEKIIYRHVTTPVIDDRDFVVKVHIHQDDETGHLLVDFASVQDEQAPLNEDRVRGHIHEGSGYRMWPVDGGKRTMLIFTIHAEAKGDIPAWIVNLFQNGYPLNNLRNIRAQTAKPDVEEHPEVAKTFRDFKPACGPDTAPF